MANGRQRDIRINYDLEIKIDGITEDAFKKIDKELKSVVLPKVKEIIYNNHRVNDISSSMERVDFEFLDTEKEWG